MTENPFDEKAATWDDPDKVARTARAVEVLRDAVGLDRPVRLFEYGAGTGLVTQALLDDVASVTLADSSEGMRATMAAKVADGSLPAEARIVALDLEVDPVPSERYDLVVTMLTLHHVTDLDRVLGAFATLLDPDGVLCIIDLDAEDGSFHSSMDVPHHGFERDALATRLEDAGFSRVSMHDAGDLPHDDTTFPMFLAVARH